MVSATALVYDSEKTLELMKSYKNNGGAKFVVQLFGNKPEHFAQAVKLIEKKIKPDGIDINFGCPVAKIVKSGAGSALFQDLDLAHEVIKACINNTSLPISIKTRISVNKSGINPPRSRLSGSTPTEEGNLTVDIFQFLERMKDLDIKAIMVHGRTLAQGFNGEIDFEVIKKVKEIFKGIVIANGGIKNYLEAQEAIERTGADGVGIGQGACGRPWIFIELKKNKEIKISKKEALTMAFKHAKLMQKLKGDAGIREMRKHLCW
jgi:tRNA-dihydrouridine synthase B